MQRVQLTVQAAVHVVVRVDDCREEGGWWWKVMFGVEMRWFGGGMR